MADAAHIALVVQSIRGELDVTRRHDVGFNMGTYVGPVLDRHELSDKFGRGCGTVACIAGHAYLLKNAFGIRAAEDCDPGVLEQEARMFLGLNEQDAADLFYDLPETVSDLAAVPAQAAIDTLERLALTGVVEWRL